MKKIIVLIMIVMLFLLAACGKGNTESINETPKVKSSLSVSWSHNYKDVEELAQNSDIIALIKVQDIDNPVGLSRANGITLYSTYFTVSIEKKMFGSNEDEIKICMTGAYDSDGNVINEIDDDPLMRIGEEYLIFAKKNADGSYTTLTGTQGRFIVDEGKVYSLWYKYHPGPYDYSNGSDYDSFVDKIIKSNKDN